MTVRNTILPCLVCNILMIFSVTMMACWVVWVVGHAGGTWAWWKLLQVQAFEELYDRKADAEHGGGLTAGRAIGFQPPRRPWHRQRQHQHSHQQRHSEKWLADRHGRLPKAKYNKAGGILVAFIYLEEGFCTMNNHTGRVICAGLYIGGEIQGFAKFPCCLPS